jgi:two-component system CheB/CheR fusion protein
MPELQRRSSLRSHAAKSEQTSLDSRAPPETSRDGGRIVVTDRPRRRLASTHLVHGSDASLGSPKPTTSRGAGGRQQQPAAAATGESPPAGILPFVTVAIGASAGGLHAYSSFLAALPPTTGMAFVLIQHLDPNHKSLLVSLLQNHTEMPVVEAADGMPLTPDVAFVIPPDSTMTISHGRLAITSPAPERVSRHPIDSCFTSLGEDQRQRAIAIVLAGAGSDGSAGLGAIKQYGGLTLAQAGDDGLPLAGMPRSAVATGLIDHVLPVGAMPAKLQEHLGSLRKEHQGSLRATPLPLDDAGAPAVDPEHFAEVCALLRHRTGHDFSQYKRPTLLRRIHRRMQAEHLTTVEDLLDLLRREPERIDRLFRELLIGVTQFMRDPAAFEVVRQTVLPKLLAGKGAADAVRIWVPGCATGEEVYSLAILLRELLDRQAVSPKVQIFGTDIDEVAIAIARAGRYSRRALAHLTPAQRDTWMVEDGKACRLGRTIREMCVFSVHSLTKDPPFSRLDMVSCRNLLIYLDRDLQTRVLGNFHYALNPGGILFLGPSENVTQASGLFTQLDRRHRIFGRRAQVAAVSSLVPGGSAPVLRGPPTEPLLRVTTVEEAIDRNARRALEQFSPAYAVIDRACEIVRFSGGTIGHFLEPSPGIASLNLFGIVRKALRPAVRSAVRTAMASHKTVVEEHLMLPLDGRNHAVALIVAPIIDNRNGQDLFVVAFQDVGQARVRAHGGKSAAPDLTLDVTAADTDLVEELSATRSRLLATISELETANEEMRSSNEEYQSTNEELQATNEELETAKEEMQSVNEELQTINDELGAKNDQLGKLNNDFQNLMDSTQIATLFLDRDLRITRFTPRVTELFRVRETDIGRPITEIAARVAYGTLAEDVTAVLNGQEMIEQEVYPSNGGSIFLMQMRPYRTLEKTVEGVVVTFVNVTQPKRLQAEEGLRTLTRTLERTVTERTAELEAAGRALTQETEERRRTEEMLRQAQKLEAVGKLTGGIAHDFNNLLGVIIGNVEFLLDVLHDRPEAAEQAREILGSALSGAELTRRLLAFARRQPLQPRRVDLNVLLPSHVAMLRRMLGEMIEVATILAPDVWPTSADPSQIGDALLNLALNARDAMPHGGTVTIATANAHLDPQDAANGHEALAGDYVVLAVTDTGVGMPPDVVERATEPFFSTKPTGSGSGLGLSMIYGFARQSGGQLLIDSEVGVGTTVRLFLPRAGAGAATGMDAPDMPSVKPGGNEAILIVDDNATLRDVARRHLTALGYSVSLAESGPAALARLRSGARFDLLFTDIVMPEGLTGYVLADAARGLQPDLRVLFTTGYAGDAGNGDPGSQAVLRKPYRRQDLAKAVRAALDS